MTITTTSTVVATPDQVSATVHGEVVILQMKDGIYYSLDSVGARIWDQLQKPALVSQLRDLVVSEYEVEPDRCERDLLKLLGELAQARLIRVS
jgi:hypothetical protein